MAEDLYFFKFNNELAKANLVPLLTGEEGLDYKNYLLYYNELDSDDEAVDFDVVRQKASDNIETVNTEELWTLFNWFYKKHVDDVKPGGYSEAYEKLLSIMKNHGLDLFFEIGSKTPVRAFHRLLWDYEIL
jgi:hypothetical protein